MSHWYTFAAGLLVGLLAGVLVRDAASHSDALIHWTMGVEP